ncbi:hypothetical protein M9Y10_015105 [Tritrichomonas musculus]|uniref:PDEase domain-containing protein n=1 Tax=Tritrichomonas musculus TaxID=1915356 RepID=A0ABR2L280_9EUKA
MRASFRSIRKGPSKPHVSNIIAKPQQQSAPVLSKHSYVVSPSLHTNSNTNINNIIQKSEISEAPSQNQKYTFNADEQCDIFITKAATMPLYAAVEQFLKQRFNAANSVYWQEIPNAQILYSPSMRLKNEHSTGIVGACYFQRQILRVSQNSSHPSFSSQIDGKVAAQNASLLLFPIYDWRNNLSAIVEIVSETGEFSQDDELFAQWFANKFKLLSKWFKQPFVTDESIHEIMELNDREKFVNLIKKKMCDTFDCREFEIWTYDKKEDKMRLFFQPVVATETGIVGDSLVREQAINAISNRMNSSYNPRVDGDVEESVLVIPVIEKEDPLIHGVCLRGSKHELFTKDDEDSLKKLAPFILLAFANCQAFAGVNNCAQSSQDEQDSLAALLDVVELLSSQLDTEKLTDLILEKGRALTNSDRCSLFLLDDNKQNLASYYQTGVTKPIVLPADQGIAGKTLKEKRLFNINDCYECNFFDSSTDKKTGYHTKTLLSVPIFSTRGEVIGVTQMINKKGSENHLFTEWDGKIIQIFNIFCGISLENAKLFKETIDTNNQLRGFLDTAFSMTKSEDIKKLINDILKNARETVEAERGSIFLYDKETGKLNSFLADGGKVPTSIDLTIGIAAEAYKTKKGIIENDAYGSSIFNKSIDEITGYKTKSIIASPIASSNGGVVGIVEMLNKKNNSGFGEKDLQTVNAFASFVSFALQNNRVNEVAQTPSTDIEIDKYLSESEKPGTKTPEKLQLTDDEKKTVLSLNCFSVNFKGVGHIKELFFFFGYYDLIETFKLTNERFLRFILKMRETYTSTSYHNWSHACDVTQYILYQITTAKADEIFTKEELFVMLTAGVCHDANHRGLNNVYNVKAETPLGILFKDQSVMEMHHITVSIPILSEPDINFFGFFDDNEVKKVWTLFIRIILATDMAHHFELVKKGQALIDNNEWSWEEPDHRLLAMQIIIKVADISNVSRPFQYADKWCDILNEEFFHQGDLEKSSGIGLTSPLNDREHPDKPKSQIGFYNFICLPLYTVAGSIFPELMVNADSVRSNLDTWKKIAAENAEKAKQMEQQNGGASNNEEKK